MGGGTPAIPPPPTMNSQTVGQAEAQSALASVGSRGYNTTFLTGAPSAAAAPVNPGRRTFLGP